jgi:hypothetical protein
MADDQDLTQVAAQDTQDTAPTGRTTDEIWGPKPTQPPPPDTSSPQYQTEPPTSGAGRTTEEIWGPQQPESAPGGGGLLHDIGSGLWQAGKGIAGQVPTFATGVYEGGLDWAHTLGSFAGYPEHLLTAGIESATGAKLPDPSQPTQQRLEKTVSAITPAPPSEDDELARTVGRNVPDLALAYGIGRTTGIGQKAMGLARSFATRYPKTANAIFWGGLYGADVLRREGLSAIPEGPLREGANHLVDLAEEWLSYNKLVHGRGGADQVTPPTPDSLPKYKMPPLSGTASPVPPNERILSGRHIYQPEAEPPQPPAQPSTRVNPYPGRRKPTVHARGGPADDAMQRTLRRARDRASAKV